ncbi:hypothetical protein Golob_023539 [Gossypium lobatum]|uniref:RNase H type-1 domain-containing protein n=1 Tax=Gossypium lobatum TaxID=34289 RepID=A0A7J8LK18_9ROSI|nr:hypothetical protein [Gossypium lobatum]
MQVIGSDYILMVQSRWTRGRLLLGGVEDQNGQWILGFNRMLGLYSIFNAELWGILNGLIVLHNKRSDKVSIHTDKGSQSSIVSGLLHVSPVALDFSLSIEL